MMLKRVLFLLAIFCAVNVGVVLYARSMRTKNICKRNKKDCLYNDNCQCYCAFKGVDRDKQPDDEPIYVENDPYGHYCYCKQRDLDREIERHKNEESDQKSVKIISSYR